MVYSNRSQLHVLVVRLGRKREGLDHNLVVEVELRRVVVEVLRNSFVVGILEEDCSGELAHIFLALEILAPLDSLHRPQKELQEVVD